MNVGFWPPSLMRRGWDKPLLTDGWVFGHDAGTQCPKKASSVKLYLIHRCAPKPKAKTQLFAGSRLRTSTEQKEKRGPPGLALALQYLQPLDSPSASPGHTHVSWSRKEIKSLRTLQRLQSGRPPGMEAPFLPSTAHSNPAKAPEVFWFCKWQSLHLLILQHLPIQVKVQWGRLGNLKGSSTFLKYSFPGQSMKMGASPGKPRTLRHATKQEQAGEIREELLR